MKELTSTELQKVSGGYCHVKPPVWPIPWPPRPPIIWPFKPGQQIP